MKKRKKYITLLTAASILLGVLTGCADSAEEENFLQNENETEFETEIESETTPHIIPAPTEELYTKLEKINNSCERYYLKSKEIKEFYSWAGFLSTIDKETKEQKEITPDMLVELGYLNEEDNIPEAFNIYMKPIDIDPNYKRTGLEMFTVAETTEGYVTYNKSYKQKIIPADTFRQILLKYNPDNGSVTNPETHGEVYNSLLVAISAERKDKPPELSSVPNYIVRYMANNDLYAIVILSGTEDVTNITEYLLKKENGSWSVAKKALENEENVKLSLNNEYPNFDFRLLPPYTLYEYRKQVMTTEHYENIFNMLKTQNIIDKSDTVTYCCGTPKVLYIEFASGKKIAGGAGKDNEFNCNFVETYEDTIKELGRFGQPVPAFILKYNH